MEFPTPEINDTNRSYWRALREGRLVIQRCACGHAWLPARTECPACLAEDPPWVPASGRGTLYSWVVYHTAYHPAFADRLPYNVALVELEEGPRLLTNIVAAADDLVAGAPVELSVEWQDDTALARFRIRSPSDTRR